MTFMFRYPSFPPVDSYIARKETDCKNKKRPPFVRSTGIYAFFHFSLAALLNILYNNHQGVKYCKGGNYDER
jgi:hypothetical protein